MKFYKELELILEEKSPAKKIERFQRFYQSFQADSLTFEEDFTPKEFEEPSYSEVCKTVPPQNVPKRSNLTSKEGQINLLHAVAHIEYSAIDLALDAAYRFHGLPREYYADWLEVVGDEIRHFLMLEKLLCELDAEYGDVEVHDALFEASQKTQTFLERMAVVPRYLEANGLDATPMILKKLKKLPKSEMIEKIIENLEIILREEVEHVKKGDVWFKYACVRENVDASIYFDIIKKYYPRGFLRPNDLNIDARREAGFSCAELKNMAKREVC
ncbi:ferritin-like domain-containing protein [Sulfurimonas paralvinellae]|uniref:Ferritin-like domain-containing protein n=1 Tax=Sulfurimonas paralvinellae TaxID=317658 RepID=A0A7M1B716_9BACT|nr:ferritin-like domain-containing protein [Sulfurimonas paralvinellae]QOP45445.1 ferritin-like domain-containing protein [Sulfurimonas paralvinellae]